MELNTKDVVLLNNRAELLSVFRYCQDGFLFARDKGETVDEIEVMIIWYVFK